MATSTQELERLQEEVKRLTQALKEEIESKDVAVQQALKEAQSQGIPFLQREIQEVLTGKKVSVRRAKNPHAQPIEWEMLEMPTYFYRIDLPPSGGISVKINGVERYHGETYELDVDELRSVKDVVHRAWAHEASIQGSNENAYRRPLNTTLRGQRA